MDLHPWIDRGERVALRSSRPGAVVPTMTCLPFSSTGSTRPSTRSAIETYLMEPVPPRNGTNIAPSRSNQGA